MKIQLDIPKELNKKLKIEKINKDQKNLTDTVLSILSEHFK
jgi:hypothetical protein